ncbi:MAG: MBOAT family protein [Clostridiales bacterium]|nr:MBOAT family protein [Clostridiales bacterium]
MSFTELTFVFFLLPLTVISALALKWLKSSKIKNIIMLVLSVGIFAYYSWKLLAVFAVFIVLVYLVGQLVYTARSEDSSKKRWMIIGVSALVFTLFYSKYFPAIISWWNGFHVVRLNYVSIIPIAGISFITFSAISYIVDIYRGDATPGPFTDAALFISFFPKFVSGPIVLWKDFQKELTKTRYSVEKISSGLNRIIIGYAKKLLIADTLGAHIAFIQTRIPTGMDLKTAWIIAIAYFFEIYYDFSGYSDIAIGLCDLFGFDIKDNFNFPYISRSITEFWRRWHISLGTWFREYVYIPLGGNRTGNVYGNLFIVFILTGIWHGANYTFILWGLAHGILIVIERAVRDKSWYRKIPSFFKWVFTMFYVFLAWILFMSPNISSAGSFYRSLVIETQNPLQFTWRYFATKRIILILLIAGIGSLLGLVEFKKGLKEKITSFLNKPYIVWAKYILLLALFILDILFMVNSSYSPFIYAQF